MWSKPLSRVISAKRPAPPGRSSTSRTGASRDDLVGEGGGGLLDQALTVTHLAVLLVVRVLPDHGAAHAEADAHGGQAVADLGVLLELARELGHQPHAGGGERVADRDRAAVGVDPRVVVGDAEVVEEREHLHRERLVDLEQADVLDAQPGAGERPLGGRDRADAHDLGLDAGEGVADQAHRAPAGRARAATSSAATSAGGRAVVEARRCCRR